MGYQCIEGTVDQHFHTFRPYTHPRSCRPERYEIRRAIHAALVSHTIAVDQSTPHSVGSAPHQEFPLSGVAQDLGTLVRLFDEILQDDYCSNHGSLEAADLQERSSACNFCGSCLFISGFLCRGCSQDRNMPMFLCAGCYVEGRSCRCDTMSPVRLGDFPDMLRDRNNAISSLCNTTNLHRVPIEGLVEISER